jgi:hypothetical protein
VLCRSKEWHGLFLFAYCVKPPRLIVLRCPRLPAYFNLQLRSKAQGHVWELVTSPDYLLTATIPILRRFAKNQLRMQFRKALLLGFGLCLLAMGGYSQSSFSLTPDTVASIKDQDIFVMYNYAEFQNLAGTTAHMRWVRTSILRLQGDSTSNTLGDWDIGVYDPSNTYLYANQLDSANFVLPATTSTNDKFILHLYPNNLPGRLWVRFRVFPPNNPADSASVVFDYTVLELNSANLEQAIELGLEVFPNPASNWISLRNKAAEPLHLTWVNAQGQRLPTFQLQPGETKLEPLQAMPAGLWWLWVKNGERVFVLPQVIE